MKYLIILRGLPASGKSTWAKQWVSEGDNRARVNNDDLASMLGFKFGKGTGLPLRKLRESMIENLYFMGYDIVVDNTNFNYPLAYWKTFTSYFSDDIIIVEKDFYDVDLDTCIERDKNRENSVGEKVIRGMYNKYLKNGV